MVHVSPAAMMPDVPLDGHVMNGFTDQEKSLRPLGGNPIPPNSHADAVWLVTVYVWVADFPTATAAGKLAGPLTVKSPGVASAGDAVASASAAPAAATASRRAAECCAMGSFPAVGGRCRELAGGRAATSSFTIASVPSAAPALQRPRGAVVRLTGAGRPRDWR